MVFGTDGDSEAMYRYGTVVSMLEDRLLQPEALPVATQRAKIVEQVKHTLNREFDVPE